MVSAHDIRDPEKIPGLCEFFFFFSFRRSPSTFLFPKSTIEEDDIARSSRIRKFIAAYMHWKYEADKNLVKRTAFKWTIVRPGGLSDSPSEGKIDAGKTHLAKMISVRTSLSERL